MITKWKVGMKARIHPGHGGYSNSLCVVAQDEDAHRQVMVTLLEGEYEGTNAACSVDNIDHVPPVPTFTTITEADAWLESHESQSG